MNGKQPRMQLNVGCHLACLCAGWLACAVANTAVAQSVEAQAAVGRPFGVAAVSFPVAPAPQGEPVEFAIDETNGRVFYPVFTAGRLARLLGDSGEAAGASGARTVLFLFQGTEPLQLTIRTPAPVTAVVQPQSLPPRGVGRLLDRWWREYYSVAQARAESGDYPPLIETYLTGMLGQRLQLRPPLLSRLKQRSNTPLGRTLELLFAAEDAHVAAMRRTMGGPRPAETAELPLPPDIAWTPLAIPENPAVEVEPMAQHVPEDCFYVRFGTFDNYMWLEELMTSYGGDVSRMIRARGHDAHVGDRIRRQLSMPYSALAKIFGGQLIVDVGLIGTDLYLQDGAAVGVLLQARNSGALRLVLQQQRNATAADQQLGATLETVSIAGQDVSFLSTPDNRIRSYYAIDGDFHLVTTSRHVAERFLQAGQGLGRLADSPEFQLARSRYPLTRGDTIFAFLSTAFIRGLMGPRYQLELERRMQAVTDLELVQLARWAARGEGMPSDTMDALVAGGFLPAGFGRAVDGSGTILTDDGAIDSLRGSRGTFLPIPDVPLTHATAPEVATYEERARYFTEQWQQLDPLVVAVQRQSERGNPVETLIVEANIAPIAEEKYGWLLSVLGPPVQQQVAPRTEDVVSVQAYVTGGTASNNIPPHLLFVGIQDIQPVLAGSTNGIWQTLWLLRTTPGYLGAWPKPGFLDWLPLRAPPSIDGYSRLPFDLWRWQGGGFSVLSFHRPVLDATVPQLQVEDATAPAQVRAHVGDLGASQLRDWVNSLYYRRAWETSIANARLLHAMEQQLHLPAADALATAENLLDVELICPLGGKYEFVQSPSGWDYWRSTAWEGASTGAVPSTPTEYRAPPLHWFRGLDLALTRAEDQVVVHAEARIERPPAPKPASGGLFDLLPGAKSK